MIFRYKFVTNWGLKICLSGFVIYKAKTGDI